MRLHQDALMRTTIDLPDDLHRILLSLGNHSKRTMSETATELLRRALFVEPNPSTTRPFTIDKKTGLPLVHGRRTITADDVKAIDDE
jgi:hypothetical protein